MSFKNMPKDQHKKVTSKGGKNRRSIATQNAWDHEKRIKEAYENGVSKYELGKIYLVDPRQITRILEYEEES